MPPSGSPVKEAILDDLQNTALALVVAGSDYYTTIEKIQRVDAGPMELKEFPAAIIVPLSTDYEREGSRGTRTIAASYRIQITLFLRTRTDAASKIERFIRDVHKAVLVDRYRNANAINTRVTGDEVFYPTEDDEPYTTANVVLEVDYRTVWDDLNAPT
jgi:hypothetical protein